MELLPQISLVAAICVGLSFKLESLFDVNRTFSRLRPLPINPGGVEQPSHLVQKVVSAGVLAASAYIVLSPEFTAQDAHWAYASMGVIAGCWFMRKSHIHIP